jgi:nucleotide-binding universal stress UspA family protein
MKRILVALDTSPRAPVVLAAAARLADQTGAKLVLFHATGIPAELPREIYAKPDRLEDILRRNAAAEVDKLVSAVKPEIIERVMIEIGTPWDAIVRAGRAVDADMIVLGSHGFSALDRLLGTTAAKVVNRADRNVLIVRTPL